MGQILKSKILSSGNVCLTVEFEGKEALQLKNFMKRVHLFSEDLFNYESHIVEKGINGGLKIVHIPTLLGIKRGQHFQEISYQKIETSTKIFYINVLKKDILY